MTGWQEEIESLVYFQHREGSPRDHCIDPAGGLAGQKTDAQNCNLYGAGNSPLFLIELDFASEGKRGLGGLLKTSPGMRCV